MENQITIDKNTFCFTKIKNTFFFGKSNICNDDFMIRNHKIFFNPYF